MKRKQTREKEKKSKQEYWTKYKTYGFLKQFFLKKVNIKKRREYKLYSLYHKYLITYFKK